ncbi:hypothetical protein JYU34_014885 [Plutella xylostella]|uniref:Lipase domain-containing protein n=1 Tax=Plutella xylostella TaxID=51655 RepID=A0ABQ7Q5S4_PLUXY|nr:hypothetical protein JYU34_014885 [Plutella xylostella]
MLLLVLLIATCSAASFKDIGKGIQKEVVAVATPVEETLVGIGSSQCSNVKKLVGVSYEQVDGEDEPDLNQLTLEYRDKSVRVIYNITTAARKIVESRDYNPRDKLLIFIHGFTDSPDNAGFGNISDSLLRGGECNVLALDGSSLIKWLYLRSTTYVRFMGERLGEVLASMVHHGVDPASIHIIGHSLGAHISGFTGKQFTNLTGARVGRISGLDPAGPCFSHVDDDVRLNSTDADFVDVIHTDAGVYGITDSVGQVDYFPNSGSQQPNCLLQSCSHSRAWLYYAESIVRPEAFPAVRCEDWEAFRRGRCEKEVSYMGYPSTPGTRGRYFLQTADEPPYGTGRNGTRYHNNEGIVNNLGGQASNLTKSVEKGAKGFGNQVKNLFG